MLNLLDWSVPFDKTNCSVFDWMTEWLNCHIRLTNIKIYAMKCSQFDTNGNKCVRHIVDTHKKKRHR